MVDYVPSGTVRSLINSTISGNEYWHTNNVQPLTSNSSNRNEVFNEIAQPESIIVLPGRNGNTKIIRKIKRTFKNKTIKQDNDQPSEENISEWRENAAFVEPSITLDQNLPTFTTVAPIINLSKASTENLIHSTATDLDNLITSKVKWDDDNEMLPLSRSPVFKTKINNQESIYEKFANLMPLPPPNTQQTTTASSSLENQINSNENSNNLQSSSHHSVVAPLSSSNNNYFNFNSKIVHTLPASRSDGNNKNQRKKQNKQARNVNNKNKSPLQDFIVETDKIAKKIGDQHVGPKKTVDFTSRVNHEISPKNNLLAHLLKNNPLAIPLGKKTYKVTKKATPSLPPTVLTKRMQPVNYANSRSSSSSDDFATTTPMSTLSNDNLDNIQFKATPSKQDYTWGRRVQASNNLVTKTNSKANQLAKRNEWSGNDEQKDLINDKISENNNESDEESVENEENTNNSEDTELVNNNEDLNNEFNKNLAAIRNEESPKFDFVTFKSKNNNKGPDNQLVKSNLNNVKSLPIQIISWRQAINHNRKKGNDGEPKQFAGERLTSAKLTVSNRSNRKEQQIEREKPRVLNKQTTKQPFSSTAISKANTGGSTFKTTSSPKLISTKSAYQNSITSNTQTTTTKRSQANSGSKSVRNPLNSFVVNRKNEAYVAPAPQTKTKSAQLFQEYEDEKETFKEELEDNFVNRQVDLHSSPKKESRVKYAKNQEFRKKSLNLVEEKNDNSIENNDQTGKF